MTSYFYLKAHHQDDDLYIHLHGTFDASSASELIQTIEKKQVHTSCVFIDTTHLDRALEPGRTMLESLLPRNALRSRIHFSGIRASDILPQGCILLEGKRPERHQCKGTCKHCACRRTGRADHLPDLPPL